MVRGSIKLCYYHSINKITWYILEKSLQVTDKKIFIIQYSSVLAWRIPWTEEPGGLPSMGLHRVGHDWSDLAAAAYNKIYKWGEINSRNVSKEYCFGLLVEPWNLFSSFHSNRFLAEHMATHLENIFYSFSCT